MGRLSEVSVIVTGAASGIGRGFVTAFAQEGAKVGIFDRDGNQANDLAQSITAAGGRAMALVGDVTNREQVRSNFESFVNWAGSLDVLFNNAGFNKPLPLLEVTEENWDAILKVNGWGVLLGIQEGARLMIPNKKGKIINTASIAGRQGFPAFAPYCASKFAVNALTQAAAKDLAKYNITCNSFSPGVVDTPLWVTLDQDLMEIGESSKPGQAIADFAAGILRGRAALPADLAGTGIYLASSDSDYLTGQTIMIDGGMVLV